MPVQRTEASVRIYPELARRASGRGEERLYRAYALAKESQARGLIPGVVATDGIPYGALVSYLCIETGDSRSSVQRWLRDGSGAYWDIEREAHGKVTPASRIFLPSPDRLARRLAPKTPETGNFASDAGRTMFRAPRSAVTSGVKAFRKLLFSTGLPANPTVKPRSYIARRTGVSSSTQKRWENEGGIYHHDGNGLAPVLSPPVYSDRTALLPSHETLGPQPVASAAAERRGYFTMHSRDRQHLPARNDGSTGHGQECKEHGPGCRTLLCRQTPRTFQSSLTRVRRRHRNHLRTKSSHGECREPLRRGSRGNHSQVISYADANLNRTASRKRKRRVLLWEAPGHRANLRMAIAANPNVTLDSVPHEGGRHVA